MSSRGGGIPHDIEVESPSLTVDDASGRETRSSPSSPVTTEVSSLSASTVLLNDELQNWNRQQVAEWLSQIGLSKHAPLFEDICGMALSAVNGEDLQQLGLSFGDAMRLLAHRKKIEERNCSHVSADSNSSVACVSASTLATVETKSFFAFARIKRDGMALRSWRQFNVTGTMKYVDLLWKACPDDCGSILEYPVQVTTHATNTEDVSSCIDVMLSDSCEGMQASGNYYVAFKFRTKSFSATPKRSIQEALLEGQNLHNRHFPPLYVAKEPGKSLNFDYRLFNWLVEGYKTAGLHVDDVSVAKLTKFTYCLRDVLLHVHQRGPLEKLLPERFRHNLVRSYPDRRVLSRQAVEGYARKLELVIGDAAPIFALQRWQSFHNDVISLQRSLCEHAEKMKKKAEEQHARHRLDFQFSDKLSNCHVVEASADGTGPRYEPILDLLRRHGPYCPFLVTAEDIDKWFPGSPGESQETARQRRCRYRNEVQVNVPLSCATYHPGGCHGVVWILWLLPEESSRDRGQDMAASNKARDLLPIHVSRQEKSLFMAKYSEFRGGVVPTSVLSRIHRELTGNCSAPSHGQDNDREKRVLQYIISNGDPDWWPDLRAATNGNNGTKFEVFWKYGERVMEQIGGAVANRQDDVRRLTAETGPISIPDLYKRIEKEIMENGSEEEKNAPRPSLNLLSIALCPRHYSREVAKYFTGRFDLRRAVESATMRKYNQDSHYNHKMNQYANALVWEVNDLVYRHPDIDLQRPTGENSLIISAGAQKVSIDDKGALPIGEPGHPVRTGVRPMSASLSAGKTASQASAMDHDWHRAKIITSVCLFAVTPPDGSQSWRTGQVSAALKDGATEQSFPMRHALEFTSQLEEVIRRDDEIINSGRSDGPNRTVRPFVLVCRSDGGQDRNAKFFKVVVGALYAWYMSSADILIFTNTAANVSHVNEVEGVMPSANLAWQHQAFARAAMNQDMEELFRSSNSGAAIREKIAGLQTANERLEATQAWRASIDEVKESAGGRLGRTVYTGNQVIICESATDQQIQQAHEWVKSTIDASYDQTVGEWSNVKKNNPVLVKFLEKHTRRERYSLEVFKCGDPSCKVCKPVRMPMSVWKELSSRPHFLPLPKRVPNCKEEKYLPYDEIKAQATSPKDRPGYTPPKEASPEMKKLDKELNEAVRGQKLFTTAKYVRHFVECNDCGRRRLIYARPLKGLSHDMPLQDLKAVLEQGSYEYICGDPLFGIEEDPYPHPPSTNMFHVKRALTCGMPMERHYYSCQKRQFGPVCAVCGNDSGLLDTAAVAKSANVKKALPFCSRCRDENKKPLVIGAVNKTGSVGQRKRGTAHSKDNAPPKKKAKLEQKVEETDPSAKKFSVKSGAACKLMASFFRNYVDLTSEPEPEPRQDHPSVCLGSFGTVVDVPGDGNCGFHAVLRGMQKLRHDNPMPITSFRKKLRQYAESAEGKALFSRLSHKDKFDLRFKERMDAIYADWRSYERGAARASWFDPNYSIPLIVSLYKVSVVLYTLNPNGDKHTLTFQCSAGDISVSFEADLVAPAQDKKQNTLYLVHTHGNHYMYLNPK